MSSLTLLQLNIEYGGTGVDFDQVIEVIRGSGASVAALQEGCGNVPRIAEALGWPHHDNRAQVVSQLPLISQRHQPPGVVLVELDPARVVALVNVHPASRGYGPFRVARGEPDEKVARRERRVRVRDLQPCLDAARSLMADGVPVVLLGDFNAPSHRDWVDSTVGLRPHLVRPFDWPTSRATEEIGLIDAYRRLYPDPVTHPGVTWPADRPFVEGYNPAADGHAEDRIDFMFVSPEIGVDSLQVMGESSSPYTEIAVDPWPTDHRGLLASLEVAPADPGALLAVAPRLVELGDPVRVRVLPPTEGSVVVVPSGGDATTVLVDVPMDAAGVGELGSERVGAGRHDVVVRDANRRELHRAALWVAGPGDLPRIELAHAELAAGEPLVVRWSWAPGHWGDWVAVLPRGADPAKAKPLLAAHTGATVDGELVLDAASHPRRWPLPAGDYSLHLLLDNLRVSLASASLSVR